MSKHKHKPYYTTALDYESGAYGYGSGSIIYTYSEEDKAKAEYRRQINFVITNQKEYIEYIPYINADDLNAIYKLARSKSLTINAYMQKGSITEFKVSINIIKITNMTIDIHIIQKLNLTEEEREAFNISVEAGSYSSQHALAEAEARRLTFIAKALSGDKDIYTEIDLSNSSAYIDLKRNIITLGISDINTYLSHDLLSVWRILKGLNFHEISHKLFSPRIYTRFKGIKEIEREEFKYSEDKKLIANINNIIEDRRVECLLCAKYPNIIPSFTFLNRILIEHFIKKSHGSFIVDNTITDLLIAFALSHFKIDLKPSEDIKKDLGLITKAYFKKPITTLSETELKNLVMYIYNIVKKHYESGSSLEQANHNIKQFKGKNGLSDEDEFKQKEAKSKAEAETIKKHKHKIKSSKFKLDNATKKITYDNSKYELDSILKIDGSKTRLYKNYEHKFNLLNKSKAKTDGSKLASELRRFKIQKEVKYNKTFGSIDFRKLKKEIITHDGAIEDFRIMKHQKKTNKFAKSVMVLCDFSGSMFRYCRDNETKISHAKQSLATLGYALDDLKVNYSLRGFSHSSNYKKIATDIILKDFSEDSLKIKKIDNATNVYKQKEYYGNKDDFSILYGASELLKESGDKILFIISDGIPAEYSSEEYAIKQTALAVKEAENSGIKVIGIGILGADKEAIKRIYPRHIILEDENLTKQLIRALSSVFKQ